MLLLTSFQTKIWKYNLSNWLQRHILWFSERKCYIWIWIRALERERSQVMPERQREEDHAERGIMTEEMRWKRETANREKVYTPLPSHACLTLHLCPCACEQTNIQCVCVHLQLSVLAWLINAFVCFAQLTAVRQTQLCF